MKGNPVLSGMRSLVCRITPDPRREARLATFPKLTSIARRACDVAIDRHADAPQEETR